MNLQITYQTDGNLTRCYLHLKKDRPKLIGIIDKTNRTLYKTITPKKHEHNKSGCIAIAYDLLKLDDFEFISITCGANIYETTKKYFIEHSTFQHYEGYELQKKLSKDLFRMDIAMVWEREETERLKNKFLSFGDSVSALKNTIKQNQMSLF